MSLWKVWKEPEETRKDDPLETCPPSRAEPSDGADCALLKEGAVFAAIDLT